MTDNPLQPIADIVLPQDLHVALQQYLEGNPDWDRNRVFTAGIALFLLQNGCSAASGTGSYRQAARAYMDAVNFSIGGRSHG